MTIGGCHLDKILAVSDELVAHVANLPESRTSTQIMHKWESLAMQVQQQHHKRCSDTVTNAFLHTRIATDNWEIGGLGKSYRYLPHQLAWYDLFGAGVLRRLDEEYFKGLDVIVEWWGGIYQEERMNTDIGHFTHDMKSVCYGRSFFITDKGSMRLAPPRAQAGDSMFFPGGLYPFLLRPCGDGAFYLVGDCYFYDFDEFSFTVEEQTASGDLCNDRRYD